VKDECSLEVNLGLVASVVELHIALPLLSHRVADSTSEEQQLKQAVCLRGLLISIYVRQRRMELTSIECLLTDGLQGS